MSKGRKLPQIPDFFTVSLAIINKNGNENDIRHEINLLWPDLPINMFHIVFSDAKIEKNINAHEFYHMEFIKLLLKEMMDSVKCPYNLSIDKIIDCGFRLRSKSIYSYRDQMERMLPEFPMEIVEFALNEYCVMTMLFNYKKWSKLMSNTNLFDQNSLKIFKDIQKLRYEQIVYYCNRMPITFSHRKKID